MITEMFANKKTTPIVTKSIFLIFNTEFSFAVPKNKIYTSFYHVKLQTNRSFNNMLNCKQTEASIIHI